MHGSSFLKRNFNSQRNLNGLLPSEERRIVLWRHSYFKQNKLLKGYKAYN